LCERRETDVGGFLERRDEFAESAHVSVYRFEVGADESGKVVTLHADPGALADDASSDTTAP
jgi:hypothetical protein